MKVLFFMLLNGFLGIAFANIQTEFTSPNGLKENRSEERRVGKECVP